LTLTAQWEQKTDHMINKRIVNNRIDEIRSRYAANLEQRKAKLANMLAAEERQYEIEFNDMQETPEQVRQHMFERLQTLKSQRESER
jgi:hypothetical protein